MQRPETHIRPRPFSFARDTFAFANELVWEYRFTGPNAQRTVHRRHPPPTYSHRCFVLVRAARQFLYHAAFQPDAPRLEETEVRRRIRQVLQRNPRKASAPVRQVAFPAFDGLRALSRAYAPTLKSVAGGAWRSYVLRSHWRMVFPISRRHQDRTAERLSSRLTAGGSPVVHLVRFPQLTINHGILLFAATAHSDKIEFQAYDPNDPNTPAVLTYDRQRRHFLFPPNAYWPGGRLDVIEIFSHWWM